MSVWGIGTDIVAIGRLTKLLDRHGDRFLARCFRESERDHFRGRRGGDLASSVAGRWAAKEAFLKALGGPIAHIPYRDIGVVRNASGGPELVLAGEALKALGVSEGQRLHLTISHEREFAVATVLIED